MRLWKAGLKLQILIYTSSVTALSFLGGRRWEGDLHTGHLLGRALGVSTLEKSRVQVSYKALSIKASQEHGCWQSCPRLESSSNVGNATGRGLGSGPGSALQCWGRVGSQLSYLLGDATSALKVGVAGSTRHTLRPATQATPVIVKIPTVRPWILKCQSEGKGLTSEVTMVMERNGGKEDVGKVGSLRSLPEGLLNPEAP